MPAAITTKHLKEVDGRSNGTNHYHNVCSVLLCWVVGMLQSLSTMAHSPVLVMYGAMG